jgi:hypothetical protein
MHPLLVAGLANGFSNERLAAAKTRRTAKAAKVSRADRSASGESVSRPRTS